MLSKSIIYRLHDGSTLTKIVYGPNELILSNNINNLARKLQACGYSVN
jgi:hypothetical protein